MGDDDVLAFKDLYLTTALENIAQFQEALAVLSKNLTDADALEQAHRAMHTLKSKSLMMGYQSTGAISKTIEEIFYDAKNNSSPLTQEVLRLLESISTKLQSSIQTIKTTDKEIDFSQDVAVLGKR